MLPACALLLSVCAAMPSACALLLSVCAAMLPACCDAARARAIRTARAAKPSACASLSFVYAARLPTRALLLSVRAMKRTVIRACRNAACLRTAPADRCCDPTYVCMTRAVMLPAYAPLLSVCAMMLPACALLLLCMHRGATRVRATPVRACYDAACVRTAPIRVCCGAACVRSPLVCARCDAVACALLPSECGAMLSACAPPLSVRAALPPACALLLSVSCCDAAGVPVHNVLLLAHIPLPSSSATLQAVLCVHGITTHAHSGPTCEQRVLTNVSRLEIPLKGKKIRVTSKLCIVKREIRIRNRSHTDTGRPPSTHPLICSLSVSHFRMTRKADLVVV
jgi:hypothetical protein